MSYLKRLFGGGGPKAESAPAEREAYEGFDIAAAPIAEGGQYRLAGTISKEIDGTVHEHQLIRADLFTSRDEAVAFTFRKARQVIDEQGERLFR